MGASKASRGLTTSELRQQIVKECVEDKISPSDLAKKWGCSPDSIRIWVRWSGQNLPESYKKPSKPESFFRTTVRDQNPLVMYDALTIAPWQRGNITFEQRQQIVKECVEDRISPSDLARKWGCNLDRIRTWVKNSGQKLPESYLKPSKPQSTVLDQMYDAESMMSMMNEVTSLSDPNKTCDETVSEDQKQSMVKQFLEESVSITDLAKKYSVPAHRIRHWVNQTAPGVARKQNADTNRKSCKESKQGKPVFDVGSLMNKMIHPTLEQKQIAEAEAQAEADFENWGQTQKNQNSESISALGKKFTKCPICGESKDRFGHPLNIQAHIRAYHHQHKNASKYMTTFPCEHCNEKFLTRKKLNRHTRKVHTSTKDPKATDSLQKPLLHSFPGTPWIDLRKTKDAKKNSTATFTCGHCYKKFFSEIALNDHKNYFHATEKKKELRTCPLCHKKIENVPDHIKSFHPKHRDRHKYLPLPIPKFQCWTCGSGEIFKENFQCDDCIKTANFHLKCVGSVHSKMKKSIYGIYRMNRMNTEIINLQPDDKQFNGANDEPEVEKIETYVEEGEYFEKDEVKEDLKDFDFKVEFDVNVGINDTKNNSNLKRNENDVDYKFIDNTFVKKEEKDVDLHPNWQALATTTFQFKKFVKASETLEVSNPTTSQEDAQDNEENVGIETKDFYDDLIKDDDLKRKKLKLEIEDVKAEVIEIIEDVKAEIIEISDDEDNIEVFDIDANKKLLVAIQNEEVETVKNLKDCDYNCKDPHGWTPLEIASITGNVKLVLILLNRGAAFGDREDYILDVLLKRQLFNVLDLLTSNKNDGLKDFVDLSEEVVLVTCNNCGEAFDSNEEAEHKASISHQLSLKHDEDGVKRNPGFQLNESNLGFQMMKKSGWDGVSGLGDNGDGKLFPVKTVFKHDRKGLEIGDKKQMRITHFGPKDEESVADRRKRKEFNVKKSQMKKTVKRGSKHLTVNVSKEQFIREDLGHF